MEQMYFCEMATSPKRETPSGAGEAVCSPGQVLSGYADITPDKTQQHKPAESSLSLPIGWHSAALHVSSAIK
jgi:hypothetical protein